MYKEIKQELLEIADSDLAKFTSKLSPEAKRKFLGVRIPVLRKMAKNIAKMDYSKFLDEVENEYVEEVILEGLVIGYSKIDFDEKLELVSNFVPKIDDWCINDTFCSTIKVKGNDLQKLWNFVIPYTGSDKEFEIRFGVIMLLGNFIIPEYVSKVIEILDGIKSKSYYAQMAIAWTLAEVGIKFNDLAMSYLKSDNNLDDFTFNKTLQKMIESYRISDKQKIELKNMRRKVKK